MWWLTSTNILDSGQQCLHTNMMVVDFWLIMDANKSQKMDDVFDNGY